jgi:hypothetical protein
MKKNISSAVRALARRPSILLCGLVLLCTFSTPASAGLMDKLFGQSMPPSSPSKAASGQRLWSIREFTQVELTSREANAADNQQPMQVPIEALRQQLARIEIVGPNSRVPLFTPDELGDLTTPLAQALGVAGPADDVLLLSAYRREGGIFGSPKAITARLFFQDGNLQLIVHDARFDFYDVYRGTHVQPQFTYGTRGAAGAAHLQSASAANRRDDWLSIPMQPLSATSGPTSVPPNVSAISSSGSSSERLPQSAAAPNAQPPAASPAAPRRPFDAGAADDIERRLETLKRLREKNLITEDEYQQKRKDLLRLL